MPLNDDHVSIEVGRDTEGNVHLNFQRRIRCLVLHPDGARDLAKILLQHIEKKDMN